MNCRFLLVPLALAVLTAPASAGIIFKKAPKPDPKTRVPELIIIVKTDKDESKRAAAAEELREYDPKAHPDIVPILIDVLMNDAKPAVRAEAAQSLGKIRPVAMEVGWALEQALAKDGSMRVRMQARSSLLQYYWAGYRAPKDGPPVVESKEPPLAPNNGPKLDPTPAPPPAVRPADIRLKPTPAPPSKPQPQPSRGAPSGPALVPAEPPPLQPTPSSPPSQGPKLEPF